MSKPYTFVLEAGFFFAHFDSIPSLLKSGGMFSSVRMPSATMTTTHYAQNKVISVVGRVGEKGYSS